MLDKLKILTSSFIVVLTMAMPQLSYGSEEEPSIESFVLTHHQDTSTVIVTKVAIEQALDDQHPTYLALVCKGWKQILDKEMQVHMPLWKALHGVKTSKDEAIYQICSNMKLIYKPDPNSDVGKVTLSTSDFPNPLVGTFDLYSSNCGTAYQYFKITTDPAAFFEIEKADPKLNILIAPYFLINKLISTTTKSCADIMPSWNKDKAPVGIFWRWSAYDNLSWFDHLLSSSLAEIGSKNLCENWRRAATIGQCAITHCIRSSLMTRHWFSCLFSEPKLVL